MIDISTEVKTLLQKDSVRKNFRAVFDDETPDITNNQIVKGTFSFRESVSSSDSLTFGATEASTITFEAVGIPNIIGKWFRGWLEFDASTLPLSMQTVFPDLPYPVYRIPLGRFVVTACPRNHEAMQHRRVTAMSQTESDTGWLNGAALALLTNCKISHVSKQPPKAFFHGYAFLHECGFPAAYELPPAETISADSTLQPLEKLYTNGSEENALYAYLPAGTSRAWQPVGILIRGPVVADSGAIIEPLAMSGEDYTTSFTAVSLAAQLADYYWAKSGGQINTGASGSGEQVALADLQTAILPLATQALSRDFRFYAQCTYADTAQASSSTASIVMPYSPNGVCIPPIATKSGAFSITEVGMAVSVAPTRTLSAPGEQPTSFWLPEQTSVWFRGGVPENSGTPLDSLMFSVTAQKDSDGAWSFAPRNEKLVTMLSGMIEAHGAFARYDRAGTPELIKLNDTIAKEYQPADYESCWWDEYDLEPVGSIAYSINGTEHLYEFGDGRSTYAFAASDFLETCGINSQEAAEAVFGSALVPALSNIRFTPCELRAKAYPFLEAGDRIRIHAHDGTEFETYMLQREISGLPRLTDDITADGITVMEVE